MFGEAYENAASLNPKKLRWTENGRGVLEPLIVKYGLEFGLLPSVTVCPVDPWQMRGITQATNRPFEEVLAGAHAVHLWHDMWRVKTRWQNRLGQWLFGRPMTDKNSRYPANTLYGHLQRLYL
jgi:hypothetical protein